MPYNALDVARHIISHCNNSGNPISNFRLQEILYFAWCRFYQERGEALFFNPICAWKSGCVIPEVYYEFYPYAGMPIMRDFQSAISGSDAKLLDDVPDENATLSASDLASRIHKSGGAWDRVFNNGKGNREEIPFSLIIQAECLICVEF